MPRTDGPCSSVTPRTRGKCSSPRSCRNRQESSGSGRCGDDSSTCGLRPRRWRRPGHTTCWRPGPASVTTGGHCRCGKRRGRSSRTITGPCPGRSRVGGDCRGSGRTRHARSRRQHSACPLRRLTSTCGVSSRACRACRRRRPGLQAVADGLVSLTATRSVVRRGHGPRGRYLHASSTSMRCVSAGRRLRVA